MTVDALWEWGSVVPIKRSTDLSLALSLDDLLELLGKRYVAAIVRELAVRPCDVHDLAKALGIHDSTVSRHLKDLRHVGLVAYRRDKNHHVYALSIRCRRHEEGRRITLSINTTDKCSVRLSIAGRAQ